jgi:hypothetical protein
MPRKAETAPTPAKDYAAKTSHEVSRLASRRKQNAPKPFGDPLSGTVLIVEPPATEAVRIVDALRRSLIAVKLDRAYVTWSPLSLEELLVLEPNVLVAVGPGAAHSIDSLKYPLAKATFLAAQRVRGFPGLRGPPGSNSLPWTLLSTTLMPNVASGRLSLPCASSLLKEAPTRGDSTLVSLQEIWLTPRDSGCS